MPLAARTKSWLQGEMRSLRAEFESYRPEPMKKLDNLITFYKEPKTF